jgi:hypothetical protein
MALANSNRPLPVLNGCGSPSLRHERKCRVTCAPGVPALPRKKICGSTGVAASTSVGGPSSCGVSVELASTPYNE